MNLLIAVQNITRSNYVKAKIDDIQKSVGYVETGETGNHISEYS